MEHNVIYSTNNWEDVCLLSKKLEGNLSLSLRSALLPHQVFLNSGSQKEMYVKDPQIDLYLAEAPFLISLSARDYERRFVKICTEGGKKKGERLLNEQPPL